MTETFVAPLDQFRGIEAGKLVELVLEHVGDAPCLAGGIDVGAAGDLGDDLIDDVQLFQVARVSFIAAAASRFFEASRHRIAEQPSGLITE